MTDVNALALPDLYKHVEATGLVRRLLEIARDEDLGPGCVDVTSEASVSGETRAEGLIVARAAGTVSGLAALPLLLEVYGAELSLTMHVQDGGRVAVGTAVARLTGVKRQLLAVERPMLNLIGHLSGIATAAAVFVSTVGAGGPVKAKVYDTRKTMPGLRVLEKYAVRCGGANCHRIGLFDAVLIKDNHLAGVGLDSLARVVADAARRARSMGSISFFEVEVDTLDQLTRVLTIEAGLVDVVLLDNMSPIQLRQAVGMRDRAGSRMELEASGGVRLETIRAIAETGVDRISAGAITHSAEWLDVAMDIDG
jgi:nicotinate-nucleotide pyrophosphorylase (carboxylating)